MHTCYCVVYPLCATRKQPLAVTYKHVLKQSYRSLNLKPFLSSIPCVNTFHAVKSLLFPLRWFYLTCVFTSFLHHGGVDLWHDYGSAVE